MIIGSGPIVIGQACEFDYSGTQACKALKQEGYEVVLVNSNPATIMTDPELADRTYVEPLTVAAFGDAVSSATTPVATALVMLDPQAKNSWARRSASTSTSTSARVL